MSDPHTDSQAATAAELEAYQLACPRLVEKTVERILSRPDFRPLFGEKSRETFATGIQFTARTLEAVLTIPSAAIMTQQLEWGKVYLAGVGVPPGLVLSYMEIFAEVLREHLPPERYPALSAWMGRFLDQQRKISSRPG